MPYWALEEGELYTEHVANVDPLLVSGRLIPDWLLLVGG